MFFRMLWAYGFGSECFVVSVNMIPFGVPQLIRPASHAPQVSCITCHGTDETHCSVAEWRSKSSKFAPGRGGSWRIDSILECSC